VPSVFSSATWESGGHQERKRFSAPDGPAKVRIALPTVKVSQRHGLAMASYMG